MGFDYPEHLDYLACQSYLKMGVSLNTHAQLTARLSGICTYPACLWNHINKRDSTVQE